MSSVLFLSGLLLLSPQDPAASAPPATTLAVRAAALHTMAGPVITDGMVLVRGGKIAAVGPASSIEVPAGVEVLRAEVVLPGLVDARSTVGLSGILNVPHDQDQLEKSGAVQPELRAVDAFNPREELVAYLREHGITTVHTGHGPGALVSGQTMVVKTAGRTVERDTLVPLAMVACTLGDGARGGGKSPGTRAKSIAMLREELLKARESVARRKEGDPPATDLRLEVMQKVVQREVPLLVGANRAVDILGALRVAKEFDLRIVIDGGAESYLVFDELRAAGVPVVPHPTMARTSGELANATMTLPKLLAGAGIPFALQSGYEAYVPKTRVVLFEAGAAAAYGLAPERALAAVTIEAARLVGVADRVGSLEVGKDADLALFDGDPLEYTTHCTGVVIDGAVVSRTVR
ncbi:MAG: hypothetical protein RL148_464 [Planctomycetota bacterium]